MNLSLVDLVEDSSVVVCVCFMSKQSTRAEDNPIRYIFTSDTDARYKLKLID